MSKLIYIDTNVYLDYVLNRSNKYLSYQDFAAKIINRTLSCEFTLIISDLNVFELKKEFPNCNKFLQELKIKSKFVNITKDHKNFAKNIPIHYPDNIHCAVAILEECSCIVTNDKEMLCLSIEIPIISSQDL
jgi:predicted nucleic acid-binding protein